MTNWEAVKGLNKEQFAGWFTQICLASAGIEDPENYYGYDLCYAETLTWMDSELEIEED